MKHRIVQCWHHDVHSEEVLTKLCRHVNVQTLCPSHQEKVSELSAEKEVLHEKLKAEEERRKHILSDKNLVRTVSTSGLFHRCPPTSAHQQHHIFTIC